MPQGIILGPLLFPINDLPDILYSQMTSLLFFTLKNGMNNENEIK